MNKITCNFAAATLSLSALLAIPGFATETARSPATEEVTKTNVLGHTAISNNPTVFTACTADNHRVTAHFFLAADAASKRILVQDVPSLKNIRLKFHLANYEEQFKASAEFLSAQSFAEDIKHSTIPLLMRQYMNSMARSLNAETSVVQISWQLRNITLSATRDPSCKVPPDTALPR